MRGGGPGAALEVGEIVRARHGPLRRPPRSRSRDPSQGIFPAWLRHLSALIAALCTKLRTRKSLRPIGMRRTVRFVGDRWSRRTVHPAFRATTPRGRVNVGGGASSIFRANLTEQKETDVSHGDFRLPNGPPSQALLVMRSKTQQIVSVCGVVAGLFLSNPAAAAPANDKRTCANASGDAAIAACERAIASRKFKGIGLAQLYYNRGVEYAAKGECDRGIADYNEAIRLDPKYVFAYNNPGD
jgi:hypothetical protein